MIARPALLGGTPTLERSWPRPCTSGARELEAARGVLESGVLSDFVGAAHPTFRGGPQVRALEDAWAAAFGVRHAVSVSSATAGLHAAVVAAGIGPGDEVIVPPQTMSATATAVVLAGATPVFVDQRPDDCCLDPAAVAAAIRRRTRAIIAVNLFGAPAPLLWLRAIADAHDLLLIEDNAQGAGGRVAGRHLGTVGDMGVFSLNFHKTIQCGEGGVVVTSDDRLARRLSLVRNHGENVVEPYGWLEDADIAGHNYRLTEVQAAIARVQLDRLEELLAPRLATARALDERLRRFSALRVLTVAPQDRAAYYVYPIWLDEDRAGLDRDRFVAALAAEGLPVVPGYVRPLYHLPLFRELAARNRAVVRGPRGARVCPNAERAHRRELFYTTLVQHPFEPGLCDAFAHAVEKILAHAGELAGKAAA
ncbi:MAG: DegT/DnrJ/EryC1/StrS family aminotransferase [Verrucomicrobiota bacterium]